VGAKAQSGWDLSAAAPWHYDTELSRPFGHVLEGAVPVRLWIAAATGGLKKKRFSIAERVPEDTGQFFLWDGSNDPGKQQRLSVVASLRAYQLCCPQERSSYWSNHALARGLRAARLELVLLSWL